MPPSPPAPVNELLRQALAHHQAGRGKEAESLYRQILAVQPQHGDALHLLGVLHGQRGEPREAVELIRRAIAASPQSQPAWHSNLGKFLTDARDLEEAVEACRRAVELKPDFTEAHVNLGNALRLSGNAPAAAAEYRYALGLNRNLAVVHKLLGATLLAMGREHLGDAISSLHEALRLNPADADAANFLGVALRAGGDNAAAVDVFREAERIRPGSGAINLGNALQALGRLDEAAESYRAVLQHAPLFPEAHNNLAGVLKEQGDVDGAVGEYQRAVELAPDNPAMHSNLLLALNYQEGSTRESLLEEARHWAAIHAAPLAREIRPHRGQRDPSKRLRIGYMTADYRMHASAFFLLPLLENHDSSRVEIYCYSDVARPDEITARCRRAAHAWRDIAGIPDSRVAELVRDDGIDILVDLKLHADNNRLLVFARKPAPVQATWLGYPGTTGLETIDYRISDPHLDPPGTERFYVEKTVRLPHTFWCYDPLSALPAGEMPAGEIVFGSLNHISKAGEASATLWSRVLLAVPGSALTLLSHEGSHRDRIARMFATRGVAAERVRFVTPRSRETYLRLYHDIHIGLDSCPVNGHTTTFDSLWMGVPVVTLGGPTALGRAGISQLRNLQLEELMAESEEDYVRIAAELAANQGRVGELRRTLRGRMEASPLMRGRDFARGMEEAITMMWQGGGAA